MKLRSASLIVLCVALGVVPCAAQYVYENGPVNGTTDAWTINFGYTVSNTFYVSAASSALGFDFYVWTFPGDTLLTVDWSMTSAEFGGTVYGSGTANATQAFISTNQFGYDINKETVFGLNVSLAAGTYWLNLANATTVQGNPVYWDENSGAGCQSPHCPSQASESALGTIPSETFDITGACCTTTTSTVPEPGSLTLFGSAMLALVGALRRRVF